MAAPISKHLTFSKLSTFHRIFGGVGGVRLSGTYFFHRKDRTASQRLKQDVSKLDHQPGPWKNYTRFQKGKRKPPPKSTVGVQKATDLLEEMNISEKTENDMPVDLPNPFVDPPKRCVLCIHNIELSYKNPQLLSQFVSPYTGRLYGRHITGLCMHMQRRVAREVRTARSFGFMSNIYKSPKYMRDPLLFNPFVKKNYKPGE